MNSVQRSCTNLVHLRGNMKHVQLEPLTDGKALSILSILFSLTFLTLIWSSVDIYQEMTTLLVFNSFKRVSLSFDRITLIRFK